MFWPEGKPEMLHLAVCDDDMRTLEYLAGEAGNWAEAEGRACSVERYASADAFLFAWEERKDTDILLLDIEMPGTDGMELARRLRQLGNPVNIIFVTGNPDFALEGYDLEAVSYLVKPVKKDRLWAALGRAGERVRDRAAILACLSAGEVEKVFAADICSLESRGHDCILWKKEGRELVCKTGIQQMEQELQECTDSFFKPHRSYFVNLEHVERIGKKEICMDNGMSVPLARGKWEELNRAYMEYFRRQSF